MGDKSIIQLFFCTLRIMGNKVNRLKSKFMPSEEGPHNSDQMGSEFECPGCEYTFGPKSSKLEVEKHVKQCLLKQKGLGEEIEKMEQAQQLEEMVPSMHEQIAYDYSLEDYLYIKEPTDDSLTKFKWVKAPTKVLQPFIMQMNPQQAKNLPFQEKSAWFRYQIEKRRVNWMNGADYMKISKNNVLMTSLMEVKHVNMYKEVKIKFIGDKVEDAGGLLRQWMHLVIEEMFDPATGMFRRCKTDDAMYRLKWDEDLDQEFSGELLTLYGVILGKTIFEKIPVNSYLDRTLLRQITSTHNEIKICDIFGFDQQLYSNWNYILDNEIDDLCLDLCFTLTKQNEETSTLDFIELVQDGKNIEVTDENKKMYIDICIDTLCRQKVQRSIDSIRKGLFRVIPQNLIRVFEPYQMEMLLYGVPFIDAKDWRRNTDYKGEFSPAHKTIRWFWELVEGFSQEQLANLLKFSTGSSRTPIHGFKKLESNRGNYAKFLIESGPFDKHNPFPKGHTCFNRLEMPCYHSKQQVVTYVSAIANNKLDGVFGLD